MAVGSGFRIVPRTNMSLALTSYGSANGTADGKSATSAGNVYVGNYTGSLNQVWYFYNKNGEQITPESFPGLQPDDYYFNNASTGAFIKRLNSDVIPMAGSLSMLGGSIKWRTESIGNGEYVIRLAADPTLYLKGSTSLPDGSGGPVSLQSITSGNVPSICRWRVEYDDGLIIINASTGYYLCCTSSTLGTVSSKYATNYKWRRVPASQYGTTSSFIMRELESVTMDSFEMNIGQSLSPTIHKRPENTTVLWAEAKDFVFSPSVSSHISINTATGEFTGVSSGIVDITATHKITGKTATFTVFIRNQYFDTQKTSNLKNDFMNALESDHFSAVSYKSYSEALDIILEHDEEITDYSNQFRIPKTMMQAILFREIWCCNPLDTAADSAVENYFNDLFEHDGNATLPHVRTDCSTGLGQIFASTATKALNHAASRGYILLDHMYDQNNWRDQREIWLALHNNDNYNIMCVGLVLLDCQYEYEDAYNMPVERIFEYNATEVTRILSRYNGTGESAQAYGLDCYSYMQIFAKYTK